MTFSGSKELLIRGCSPLDDISLLAGIVIDGPEMDVAPKSGCLFVWPPKVV